jgi:putative acetyltransferase
MPAVSLIATNHLNEARELLREYAESIGGVEICFQTFEVELNALPGQYAEPEGCLLVAKYEESLAGCVALRPIDKNICEMKRLYVRPTNRGHGIGKLLVEAVIQYATQQHYTTMQLDSLLSMREAHALYRRINFREVRGPRTPEILYFERNLTQPNSNPAMA